MFVNRADLIRPERDELLVTTSDSVLNNPSFPISLFVWAVVLALLALSRLREFSPGCLR